MSWDSTWEKVFQQSEWSKYPAESLIRFVAGNYYTGDRKSTRILEIGCGPGANIWYMSREGFDVYGIDGSETAIKRARTRLEEERLKATLEMGDIVKLPYDDGFFDAVLDVECLCCNTRKDTEDILADIKRVLKKDGVLYSRTFSDDMYLGRSQVQVQDLEYRDISDGPLEGTGFVRLIDRDGIADLYGRFFEVISVDKLVHTRDNGLVKVSEWIVVCRNKE